MTRAKDYPVGSRVHVIPPMADALGSGTVTCASKPRRVSVCLADGRTVSVPVRWLAAA